MDVASTDATDKKKAGADVARLFTAVWPAPDLARSISALCGDCTGVCGSQVVATDSIHLTLHFLGNVPRHRMPELVRALNVPFRPFEFSLSRCENWRHGLVVAIPEVTPQPLIHLHAELGNALRCAGLRVDEREFRPHLTLARRHFQALPKTTGPPLLWMVDSYVLVESRATSRGEYQVVHRYG